MNDKPGERLILEAGRADRRYWGDLWRYRELFFILAWRDVALRYKQTVIGLAWAFVRPFMTMVVFTVIFGHIAKLPTEGTAPYAVLVLAGLLPWTLVSSIFSDGANNVLGNSHLVSKVYFPRLIIPLAPVVVGLIDFVVSLVILFGVMAWYGVAPDWHILLLPVFTALAVLVAIGPAMWAAATVVKYRDFRFVIPFAIQIGLYVSPVGFSAKIVPAEWKLLYSLNPMVGVIDGFRWAILGGDSPLYLPGFALSLLITAGMLWLGIRTFRNTERGFADVI
jgi:lipopolysaccharide transport system permease protein